MIYPDRHKPYEEARGWKPLAAKVLADPGISQREWERIGGGLLQGDRLADALVEWMSEVGMPRGRKLFRAASEHGLSSLSIPDELDATPLVDFFEACEHLPDWVDLDLVDVGRRFIDRCHPVPYYVLRNIGLLSGYTWRDLNKPLVMTGALDAGATRRVAQTMKWFDDCVAKDAFARGGRGYRSTLHVRLIHASVRRWLSKHEEWEHEDMGLPINQTDMAATWLAFSVILLAGARMMGVLVSRKEALGVMHLWKTACWLLGVEEHWLTDDEREGRRLLYHILSTYRGADASSVALARALTRESEEIPYPGFRALRWRVERAKHLSVVMAAVGPNGMRDLGLPRYVLPWYPMVSFPYQMARSAILRLPTPLQAKVEERGAIAREELVRMHFMGKTPDLATPVTS